jgi:O-antigen/teichoic acid export membrane protein
MLKFGLPLIPTNLAAFTVHASDRFFIKHFTGLADAGIYSLGYRFGNLPNEFIAVPFMQIWEVRFLKAYKERDASKLFGQLFTYLCFLLICVGLGISALIKEVLMIISQSSYWGASKIVPVVVIAYIIFSFQYFFNMGISFEKKTHYFAYINVSNAILNIILNLTLIKMYGMWGAAFATLICFVYKVSITYYISNRLYKIDLQVIRIGKMALAALGLYLVCQKCSLQPVYLSLTVKTIIICTFPLIIYFLKFYTAEEKVMLRKLYKTPRYALFQILGR